MQTSVFPDCFHGDDNILLCAPTGTGKVQPTQSQYDVIVSSSLGPSISITFKIKTNVLEIAICRMFSQSSVRGKSPRKAVYIGFLS
jgi:hypothetical protein